MDKSKGQLIGYIRVSSAHQNSIRQEDQLAGFKPDRIFMDKASGKDVERPQLQEALRYLREGDTFLIHSMDRLARNLDDLRKVVKELTGKGVVVQFIKEGLSFTGEDSPMSHLLLSVMGAFAEFERSLIKERQREGIELAKQRGAYTGRKPALTDDAKRSIRDQLAQRIPKSHIAKTHGISRETLYQFIRSDTAELIAA